MTQEKDEDCVGFVQFEIDDEEDHHTRNRANARQHKDRRFLRKKVGPFIKNQLTR